MTAWLVETLLSSTLLMLFVLAVRKPAARTFGAHVAYALWLLPAARIVLPPLPGHRSLLGALLPAEVPPVTARAAMPVDMPLPPAPLDALAPVPSWSLPAMLLAVWTAGALLWFGWQLLRYRRFLVRALDGATLLGRECGVDVLLSDGVDSPAAAGILRRRILLPRDFVHRYDAAERRQALLHEGAHHDRRDLLANLAALLVVAAHWWNPLAHLAHRAFRADQELACDATVLAGADGEARYAYGRALVKSTAGGMPAAACALDNATAVKRRLRAIGRGGAALPVRVLGGLLATAAIGGGLMATASAGAPTPVATPFLPPIPAPPAPPAAPMPPLAPIAAHPEFPSASGVVAPPEPVDDEGMARDEDRRQREAERMRREAGRFRREVQAEARRGAAEAQRAIAEGERARAAARFAGEQARTRAQTELDAARARMAAACIARGRPVAPDERDWGELALCGRAAFQADIRRTIAEARATGWPHVRFRTDRLPRD